MSVNFCSKCGGKLMAGAVRCGFCGEIIHPPEEFPDRGHMKNNIGRNPAWRKRNKVTSGLLGIFLGGFGIHKFYLGKVGTGIVYILFCWTFIPAVVGFIEGIVYLCSDDENFQLKHHVRLE